MVVVVNNDSNDIFSLLHDHYHLHYHNRCLSASLHVTGTTRGRGRGGGGEEREGTRGTSCSFCLIANRRKKSVNPGHRLTTAD